MAKEEFKKTSGQRIMDKPLPEILDEIDAAIVEVGKATANANKAAADARQAGEEAGRVAEQRANQVVDQLRKDYDARFKEIEVHVNGIDNKLSAAGAALLGTKK
jgi:hypothetical protein